MPDYSMPDWILHPGQELADNVARGLKARSDEQQRQFENARQTAQDKLAAGEAARKLTAMQGYSDDITALQKQYPNGGPEFNNGVVIAGMKRFGDSPGAMSAGARALFTPQDYATPPGTLPAAPPQAVRPPMVQPMPAAAAPVAAPQGFRLPPPGAAGLLAPTPQVQGQMPVAAPVGAAPVPPPAGPPVAAPGASPAPQTPVPVSFRAIQAAQKAKEAEEALALRKASLAQAGQSQTNNLALRKDALANTETNQAATRQFHEDTLANTEANQKIQQTQRRLNLAFRNKALAATVQGRKLTAYLRMAQDDPKNAADLTKRANELMDEMGVDKDGEAKTPEATTAPVTATNPKTGEKVQLIDGKWQPVQQ